VARALIRVVALAGGGWLAQARCSRHHAHRWVASTPEIAVTSVQAAHAQGCGCAAMATAPVRVVGRAEGERVCG
jgi:hypothetical protein